MQLVTSYVIISWHDMTFWVVLCMSVYLCAAWWLQHYIHVDHVLPYGHKYHSNSVPGQWSPRHQSLVVVMIDKWPSQPGCNCNLPNPHKAYYTLLHIMKNILRAMAKLSNIKYFNLYVVSIEFFTVHLNHECKLCSLNCHYYFNMRSTLVFKHKKM